MHLSLILPAYNEARRISETLASVRAYLDGLGLDFEVIVSRTGRTARGRRAAEAAAATRGSCDRPPGAAREGARRARGHGPGPRTRRRLRRRRRQDADRGASKGLALAGTGLHVVIGSRAHARVAGRGAAALVPAPGVARVRAVHAPHAWALPHVRDTQCGFKFFRGDVGRLLFAQQRMDGYMFDIEMLYPGSALWIPRRRRWACVGATTATAVSTWWPATARNLVDLLRIRFGRARAPAAVVATPPS